MSSASSSSKPFRCYQLKVNGASFHVKDVENVADIPIDAIADFAIAWIEKRENGNFHYFAFKLSDGNTHHKHN